MSFRIKRKLYGVIERVTNGSGRVIAILGFFIRELLEGKD